MTRYVIVGAGAIGGTVGGRLTAAGRDAVLVARGDHLEALRRDGLRLRTPDEDTTIPVTAAASADELTLTPDDVLVLTVKTDQVSALLPDWADAPVRDGGRTVGTAAEVLPLVVAMNGVTAERMALRYFDRVVGACVWMPAVHLVPGEVIVRSAPLAGMFHLGRVAASSADDADRALLRRVEEDWSGAGLAVRLPADVLPWKYRKLLSNLGNSVQALVGRNGDPRPIADAAEEEGRSVLDAAGIAVISEAEESATRGESVAVRPVPGAPAEVGGSTWQSLKRGATRLESDYLNGEIALIARQHGRTAPINAALAALARRAARRGARPGDLSAAELAAALDSALRGRAGALRATIDADTPS